MQMDHFSKDLKFAFSDFIALLKRNKKVISYAIIVGAALCFLLAVTRPVHYILQSSFRDKGKTQANIHSSLTELLISSNASQDSETISVMKSHFLLSKVIKQLHLQGKISKIQPGNPHLQNALDNIFAEWAYWGSWQIPILEDPKETLSLTQIDHESELKGIFILDFQDPTHFQVMTENAVSIGNGALNVPFQHKDSTFTVSNPKSMSIEPEDRFVVVIEPMAGMVNLLIKDLAIQVDREDKSLLRLQFKSRNRHMGKRVLNTLMATYQKHLEEDHELSSSTQVNYLERRQKEAGASLESLMENYVKNVSDDMSKSGFTSLQTEMDFLAANLAANQQKLTEIDLETKRLKNINCDDCVHYDSYTGRGDPAIINHLLAEIRGLKQQGDSLELALQNKRTKDPKEATHVLEENFLDLISIKNCLNEADALVASLQNGGEIPDVEALDKSGYSVGTWMIAYDTKESLWQTASGNEKKQYLEDLNRFKNHFLSYLDTFKRLLKIQEATLEQRMRTQKNPGIEFEGITLETSHNLFMGFVQELHTLEAAEKQHRFVVEQLISPNFELSSLTALLNDPISQQRIAKASEIVINLKDSGNRTQKELERLSEELELQKQFLKAHILQMADLLKLKIELTQEKIASIQNTTLDLTHQKISLLKKHLADYIKTRLDNFVQEKKLLEEDQIALHQRMASIPPKWASEQLLNQNLALQQRFLENLANMVESKNITKNLEMIQSSALDKAIPPLHPKPPRLLFFTIFGAVLGLICASLFLFTRTMIHGIPASLDNLRLAQFHVSGKISPFQGDEISASAPFLDSDLDTLRRLIARYEKDTPGKAFARLILIAPGNGPDFSNTLAKLLAKKGQTALKLQLGFNQVKEDDKLPGLLQYLENKADAPFIEDMDGFDKVSAGGVCRYSEELLRSPRFVALLEKLKTSYDWILGVSPMRIPSAEAENLAKLFDGLVVVVTNETLQNLIAFNDTLDQTKQEALTFVVAENKS